MFATLFYTAGPLQHGLLGEPGKRESLPQLRLSLCQGPGLVDYQSVDPPQVFDRRGIPKQYAIRGCPAARDHD